ncbi:hypothetical protein ACFWN7_04335 [Agromyces sp. NPDC058484]|uniref:hypothetical protein n=1 Tax=Agromyces sp. NPDC058484 TaxID=3346524 RepID=UPI00365D7E8C
MSGGNEAELEARIAALEAENEELRANARDEGAATRPLTDAAASVDARPPRRRWGRTAAAIVLVVLGVLLAPVAVVSAWARLELVDTERFVATFAPLAEDPAVQRFIASEVTGAIERQVDIPELTKDVFDGIRSLDLPENAKSALSLLEAPAAEGLKSLLESTVTGIVESPTFADTWATALRFTHREFVAAVQGDPDSAVSISGTGELSVQLGPVIEEVKRLLAEQGIGFAEAIPSVQLSIVVAQADSLVLVQSLYALAVGVGTWLPWVSIALLVAGVLVARNRSRALLWTAIAFSVSMIVLAAGFGIGRVYAIATLSPSIMPADTVGVLFDELTELMRSVTVTLIVLGVLIALIAWSTGPWRPAVAMRGFAAAGFDGLRSAAARHGLTTGGFGERLDRMRGAAYAAIAVIAALVILFVRPLTVSLVLWTVVLALLALLVVQVLRRPPGSPEPAPRVGRTPATATPEPVLASLPDPARRTD